LPKCAETNTNAFVRSVDATARAATSSGTRTYRRQRAGVIGCTWNSSTSAWIAVRYDARRIRRRSPSVSSSPNTARRLARPARRPRWSST
jgi:hypothetical protein